MLVTMYDEYATATTSTAFNIHGRRSRNVGFNFREMVPFPNKRSSQTSNRSGCSRNSSAHWGGIQILPMTVVYQI